MTGKDSMIYLFNDAGRAALRNFIERSTLFAFDLDGTLAPLVVDPALIEIPDEILEPLIRLNKMAPVAVITGRALNDALPHLGFKPGFLVGNHGAEGLPGREKQEKEFYRQGREWRAQLDQLMTDFAESAIFLEDKGATFALHYRNTPDQDTAKDKIIKAIKALEPPPRRVAGKFVENIVPVDAPHKGDALLQLMSHTGCSRAIYVGDDVTDEDVFNLRDERIFGVRIGAGTGSSARYYLRDIDEMAGFIEMIIEGVSGEGGS